MGGKRVWGAVLILALVALGGYWAAQHRAVVRVDQEIQRLEEQLPAGGSIAYGDVEVRLWPRRVQLSDVHVSAGAGPPIRIDRVVVHQFQRRQALTTRLQAEFSGVRQPLEGLPAAQAARLRELGYQRLRGDYRINYTFEPQAGRLIVGGVGGAVEAMADVTLRLRLTGVAADLERPLADQQSALFSARLERAELIYRDRSLLPRAIGHAAEKSGVSREEAVAELVQTLERQLGKTLPAGDLRALKSFVRRPGTLHLTAAPEEPVSTARLLSLALVAPRRLPAALGLQIQAE